MENMRLRPAAAWIAKTLMQISPQFREFVENTSDEDLDGLVDPYEETIDGISYHIDWGNKNIGSIGEMTGPNVYINETIFTLNEPYTFYIDRMTDTLWNKCKNGTLRIPHVISFGDQISAPNIQIGEIIHNDQTTNHFLLSAGDETLAEILL